MISSANLLCVLLTYLIESSVSAGGSYEFNVVFVLQEKYSTFHSTTTYEVYILKTNKRKLLKDIFVYNFLFYIYLFVNTHFL